MLKGFIENNILTTGPVDQLLHKASGLARDIAVLGLPKEAGDIWNTIILHPDFRPTSELLLVWKCTGFAAPDGLWQYISGWDALAKMAPAELSRELISSIRPRHPTLRLGATGPATHDSVPQASSRNTEAPLEWTEFVGNVKFHPAEPPKRCAVVLSDAYRCRRDDLVPAVMSKTVEALRYGADTDNLCKVLEIWEPYFLSGWTREQLGLSREAVQGYAAYVQRVVEKRLTNGRKRYEEFYENHSLRQILDEIDENTIESPLYRTFEYPRMEEDKMLPSILHAPASTQQIQEAEERIGRSLPEDIQAYFRLTNGCGEIAIEEGQSFKCRLPPVEEMEFEDWQDGYSFALLPNLGRRVEVDWPGVDRGIKMYEPDGQGTEYVWIMDGEKIAEAKEKLAAVYEAGDESVKLAIDGEIVAQYGSREAYDAMQDYCLYLQFWGDPQSDIFPTIRPFLCYIAFESRRAEDPSPLKALDEEAEETEEDEPIMGQGGE